MKWPSPHPFLQTKNLNLEKLRVLKVFEKWIYFSALCFGLYCCCSYKFSLAILEGNYSKRLVFEQARLMQNVFNNSQFNYAF